MKIKRYTAPSMRAALALVRAEQGPDAVILSSRRSEEGIEVIAAVDYDEALFAEAKPPRTEAIAVPAEVPAPPRTSRSRRSAANPAKIAAVPKCAARQSQQSAPKPVVEPPAPPADPRRPRQRTSRTARRQPPPKGTAPCSGNCRICAGCSRPAWPA